MMRFIGDVHGKFDRYREIAADRLTIQVGDFGLDYGGLTMPPGEHYVLGGNHDRYLKGKTGYWSQPWRMGEYGIMNLDGISIGYIRGGHSLDWKGRMAMGDGGSLAWYPNDEELSYSALDDAIHQMVLIRPDVIVTHEAPLRFVSTLVGNTVIKTRTNQALDELFNRFKPKRWICGHYHVRCDVSIHGCHLTCLDMVRDDRSTYCYVDVESGGF
jgi:hypothetical protein